VEEGALTERYCLLGGDVSRSLSPAMMNAAFASTGLDAEYEAVSLKKERFRSDFLELREKTGGLNVTIPYKADVIPLLDELDPISSRIGAVNVVKRSDGRYLGYNSDANGIVAPLKEHRKDSVRSALLVGAGGAARAFCEAMSQIGCGTITVTVRDPSRGEKFIAEMAEVFPRMSFNFTSIGGLRQADVDLIFNATPIGASDEPLPESLKRVIYGRSTVFDAVYRPLKTELLRTAEMRGCSTIYGYEMLLSQGTLAFEIWTGRQAPKEVMRKALLNSLGAAA
jgi:shikimate dehydrogenase